MQAPPTPAYYRPLGYHFGMIIGKSFVPLILQGGIEYIGLWTIIWCFLVLLLEPIAMGRGKEAKSC